MSCMIAAVVWLVIYPYDMSGGNEQALRDDLSLTSLSMHAVNVVAMFVEFGLDSLFIHPHHFGLVIAWAMLYALFNGMQALWTNDTIYYFTDFTIAKSPLVAVALTLLLGVTFAAICRASEFKRQLILRQDDLISPEAARAFLPAGARMLAPARGAAVPADEDGMQDYMLHAALDSVQVSSRQWPMGRNSQST